MSCEAGHNLIPFASPLARTLMECIQCGGMWRPGAPPECIVKPDES